MFNKPNSSTIVLLLGLPHLNPAKNFWNKVTKIWNPGHTHKERTYRVISYPLLLFKPSDPFNSTFLCVKKIFINHEVSFLTVHHLARSIFIGSYSLYDEFKWLSHSWSKQDGVIFKTQMIHFGGPPFHEKSMIVMMIMETI